MIYIILWIIFSIFEGIREGYYFNSIPASPKRYNIHTLFTAQRLTVLAFIIIQDPIAALVCVCMFPFIHDGFYYDTRNKLNPNIYTKGFWDAPSKTSTARFDFSLGTRLFFYILGLLIALIYTICSIVQN